MHATLVRLSCILLAICCLMGSALAETAAPTADITLEGVNSLFIAKGSLYANCWSGLFRLDEQAENPVPIAINEKLPNFQKMTAYQDMFFAFGSLGDQSALYSLALTGDTLNAARELAAFPAPEGENAYCDCAALVRMKARCGCCSPYRTWKAHTIRQPFTGWTKRMAQPRSWTSRI